MRVDTPAAELYETRTIVAEYWWRSRSNLDLPPGTGTDDHPALPLEIDAIYMACGPQVSRWGGSACPSR